MGNKLKIIKNKDYSIVSNKVLEEKSISWKAKGLFIYLLSRDRGYVVSLNNLEKISTNGLESIRSGIQELRDNDYVERVKCRLDNGQFKGYVYKLNEYPNGRL